MSGTKTLEIAEALADADFQLRALWGFSVEEITRGNYHVTLRIAERTADAPKLALAA